MAKGKILIIDDSPLVRKLAEVSLQEAGHEVYTAENGEDGLKIAETVVPDLILVDFIMPVMTGSQFCALLRENEKLKNIPIILITGKGESVGQTFVEKFGVVDYFIKPFKSEDLVEKVEEILKRYTQIEIEESHPIIEESIIEQYEDIDFEDKFKKEILFEEIPLTSDLILEKEEILFEAPDESTVDPEIKEEEIKMSDYPLIDEKFEEEKPLEETINQEISEDIEKIEIPKEIFEKISEEIEVIPSEIQDIQEEIKPFDLHELADETLLKSEREETEFYETIEVIPDRKEEMEEAEKIPIEPEQKFQTIPIDMQAIENIIDSKLKRFSEELIPSINLNFENILKKYGLINNLNIILSGKLEGFGLENLFEFLENIKTCGLLTIFTKDLVFEIFIIDGYIVYCLSDRTIMRLGDKLLKEIDQTELKEITKSELLKLMNSEANYFSFEKKECSDIFLQSLPKYKFIDML